MELGNNWNTVKENQKMIWNSGMGSNCGKNHLKFLHIKENRLGNTFVDNTRVKAFVLLYEILSTKRTW